MLVNALLYTSGVRMADHNRAEYLATIQPDEVPRRRERAPKPSAAFLRSAGIKLAPPEKNEGRQP